MYFVYILYSATHDAYYVGQTNDLDKRLLRHNSGFVKYTKPRRPWELVYFESYESRAESMSREKQIKSWKSKVKIKELVDQS